MNWLAWWAALCVGAAVWLCMRAPHARLRDAHEAPGASAGETHIGSGNRGVSVVLAGIALVGVAGGCRAYLHWRVTTRPWEKRARA